MHEHADMLLLMQIVFPEAHWIGTKDENPTEKQLPMPAELQLAVQHEKYAFGGAATQAGEHSYCKWFQRLPLEIVLHVQRCCFL